MQDRSRPAAPATLDFTPVPRRSKRHDGWTPVRQRGFIAALARTGSVTAAARAVNMSPEGAYLLYNHPDAASFRAAWDHALSLGVQSLHDIAMDRVREGVPQPIFYKGEQVGERRQFGDHLLVQLLKHHAGGYAASPVGKRSRASIEQAAAENCPNCRARAAHEESEAREVTEFLSELLTRYARKVEAERKARLAGDLVTADFTLRQLTWLELAMEGCGMAEALIACWADPGTLLLAPPTDFVRELDAIKAEVWAKAGDPPRPRPYLDAQLHRDVSVMGGPTLTERGEAQDGARRRIDEALAVWEATRTEEAWAAFRRVGDG